MRLNAMAAAALGVAGAVPAFADDVDLAAVREASAKYQDVAAALADGFVPDPGGCISAAKEGLPPELGAMGIHYLNPARLQVTATSPRVSADGLNTDFLAPSILLYEPQPDGTLVLVAVENGIFVKAWEAAGNSAPPAFGDVPWMPMADDPATPGDEAHGFEPHYDLHVWVGRDNPAGPFAPFNPAVTCPAT